jgi:hypothetical protein
MFMGEHPLQDKLVYRGYQLEEQGGASGSNPVTASQSLVDARIALDQQEALVMAIHRVDGVMAL